MHQIDRGTPTSWNGTIDDERKNNTELRMLPGEAKQGSMIDPFNEHDSKPLTCILDEQHSARILDNLPTTAQKHLARCQQDGRSDLCVDCRLGQPGIVVAAALWIAKDSPCLVDYSHFGRSVGRSVAVRMVTKRQRPKCPLDLFRRRIPLHFKNSVMIAAHDSTPE
jgi:hypothetical protein